MDEDEIFDDDQLLEDAFDSTFDTPFEEGNDSFEGYLRNSGEDGNSSTVDQENKQSGSKIAEGKTLQNIS